MRDYNAQEEIPPAETPEQICRDARDASRVTFATKFPLMIALATLMSLVWNGRIRWGAVSGGTFMALIMLSQAVCLFRFAAVLGYRSLCHRHWIFALFCLGPMVVLANVALTCAGAGFTTLHQGDESTWVLVTLILVSIPLGLMIDLNGLPHAASHGMSKASAMTLTASALLISTVCSFSSFGERAIGQGGALAVRIFSWYSRGTW